MAKFLLGCAAAIAIALGGFFGFELYIQHRVAGQIDAAFDQIRASGGKASHGKVSFDLLKHTVTIADVATEAAEPAVRLKIGNLAASGVSQGDASRFSADTIDAADVEFDIGTAAPGSWHLTYKAPHVVLKDFSAPADMPQPPASSSAIDLYRYGLNRFAAMAASSISANGLSGTIDFGNAMPGAGHGEFTYSRVAIEGIKDGKIASAKADGVDYTLHTQSAGRPEQLTGSLASAVTYDIDTVALAAALDPQNTGDDGYHRVYRQITAGPYTLSSDLGMRARIEAMAVDDVGFRSSRFDLPAILAMLPQPGTAPSAAQARGMMEKVAGLYEAIRIGNAEIRGMSIETPQGPVKLSTVRYAIADGKADVALEGLEGHAPNGPFQVGRLALKSFDIAGLMRLAAQFAAPGQRPSPGQALALLKLLEGAEIKGVVAPFKNTGKQVTIDTVSLDWGQFVGMIPTQAHLIAKMVSPVDATDPAQRPLLAAGLDAISLDLDLGAAWTEASGTFALAPATIDLGNLVKAQAGLSLANVPRGVFSADPAQAANMAAQIEVGAMDLTLHDAGSIDAAVAQYARIQNLGREAARSAIVDAIKANGAKIAGDNPDGAVAVEAVSRFFETPGQTLIIKLTPRAKIPALQFIQLLKTDPPSALAQFKIEASTGL